jgi:hypothetical protein
MMNGEYMKRKEGDENELKRKYKMHYTLLLKA